MIERGPETHGYTVALDWSGTDLLYLGLAPPGSAKADPNWQIRKFTVNGDSNPTDIQYANGSRLFNQIWDNRALLSYP